MAWPVVMVAGEVVVAVLEMLVGLARFMTALCSRVTGVPRAPEAEIARERQKDHTYYF